MPLPTNCRGYIVNDPSPLFSSQYLVIEWDRAEWDGDIEYSVTYLAATPGITAVASALGMSSIVIKSYRAYTSTTAQDYADLTVTHLAPISGSLYRATVDITCAVATQTPTLSPTIQPTAYPVMGPGALPTASPTHDEPGVYISDENVCTIPRCECFKQSRDCCIPYGSNLPSQGVCEQHIKYITIPSGNTQDYQQEIRFTLYPDGYTAETIVYYQLKAYGQFNVSVLENIQSTMTPKDDITNTLKILVDPIGSNEVHNGNTTIVDGDEFATVALNINAYDLVCNEGSIDCITFDECVFEVLLFKLSTIKCDIDGRGCMNMYPSNVWISIGRSSELCSVAFSSDGSGDAEIPGYIWWILIALIVFCIIMGCLIYRYWWRQKQTVKEISEVEDDLINTVNEIEQGIAKDLDQGDIMFNEFATGDPNHVRVMDPAGNELYEREKQEEDEFAHVDAERFQVRQAYGPQPTENSIDAEQL